MIKIYGNCPQCTMLKKELEKMNIQFTSDSANSEILDRAEKEGIISLPIVTIGDVLLLKNSIKEKLDYIKSNCVRKE
jgi:glutaredoxin